MEFEASMAIRSGSEIHHEEASGRRKRVRQEEEEHS
jgi:hypothetical protein